jgi:hypothetical protein
MTYSSWFAGNYPQAGINRDTVNQRLASLGLLYAFADGNKYRLFNIMHQIN